MGTNGLRKLSIGGDSNSRTSPELASPGRLRRTWTPQKEKEPAPKEHKQLFKEEPLPPPVSPTYQVPSCTSGFPQASKANLPRLPVAKNRVLKSQRDLELEQKVLQWIKSVVHERPTSDYDSFIQDGSILSKVMTSIVFNSVPLEQIDDNWGTNPALDRVKAVIREIKRYGVVDVFEPEDLIQLRNIPKVTKCLAQLSKLAASDKDNLLSAAL